MTAVALECYLCGTQLEIKNPLPGRGTIPCPRCATALELPPLRPASKPTRAAGKKLGGRHTAPARSPATRGKSSRARVATLRQQALNKTPAANRDLGKRGKSSRSRMASLGQFAVVLVCGVFLLVLGGFLASSEVRALLNLDRVPGEQPVAPSTEPQQPLDMGRAVPAQGEAAKTETASGPLDPTPSRFV